MPDAYEDYQAPNLAQEITDGGRAKAILEDPVFIEAFEGIRATLMQAWISTAPSQEKEREYLWMQIKAADDLKRNLTTAIETGKLAAGTLPGADKGLLSRLFSQ